ncbi:hypothetical protein pb186bvf_003576 [Paramecium bursaria]
MAEEGGVLRIIEVNLQNQFNFAFIDCAERCDVVRLDAGINNEDEECLRNCGRFHMGARTLTTNFIKQFRKNFYAN